MRIIRLILCVAALSAFLPSTASAHCDSYDGPVVKAGQKALETGDLHHALIWVKPASEPELRAAFKQTTKVRGLGADARVLADRYFLETLVRLHRAGEGEPYTGLKPAGTDLGPVVVIADAAVASGSIGALSKLITDTAVEGLQHRLERVVAKRKFKPQDIERGREYVEAYTVLMHYAEQLHAAALAHHAAH